jgi:hypothetical protein
MIPKMWGSGMSRISSMLSLSSGGGGGLGVSLSIDQSGRGRRVWKEAESSKWNGERVRREEEAEWARCCRWKTQWRVDTCPLRSAMPSAALLFSLDSIDHAHGIRVLRLNDFESFHGSILSSESVDETRCCFS